VLEMSNFDISCDLAAVENACRLEHDPGYVICKVPAEDLRSVHALVRIPAMSIERSDGMSITCSERSDAGETIVAEVIGR
jgi:hypothetical protein